MTEPRTIEPGKIGVVTVTYNSEPVLQEFFDSLAAQTHGNSILYVVDNASQDRTLELTLKRTDLPITVMANQVNLGVAEGNNQGIRAALADGCECVLLINNDTVFPADLIAQLYAGLDRYHCDMTTPKIYYHGEPNKIWAAGGYFQPWLGYRVQHYGGGQREANQFDTVRSVTYAPTCCVLVHENVFSRVGLMDPLYFVYLDDVDFMYRCLKAGLVMKYLPYCMLWHKVNSLTGGDASQFAIRYCTRNRIYFLRKYPLGLQARLLYLLYLTYYLLDFFGGRSSRARWRLRRASAAEGWKMASPDAQGR